MATPCIKRDGDFNDLVTQSTIFADKSLFIKDVIEDENTILLLAMPRRWGKTVNLDMLRRFLEIPVDENGKVIDGIVNNANFQLFRKEWVLQPNGDKSLLRISQSKILVKNQGDNTFHREVDALKLQGTYPVIYIDFKNCKASTFDAVRDGVKIVLNCCFKEHRYLETSDNLDEEEKELIKRYVGVISSENLGDDKIKYGLFFLSEMLHKHYGKKKVWILIDEYDAVANVAYRKFNTDDRDKTIELFAGIYETALKGNKYLEKGVLTGVQSIVQSGMLSGLNNLGKFNFTDAKYVQYYGLDQYEVDHFFDHFKVPKQLANKAKFWYNGYKVQKYHGNLATSPPELVSKYNIWSIISYLNLRKFHCFKSHWVESGNIDFLEELLLTKPRIREEVEKLIDGRCISFVRKDDFSVDDFKQLKNMIDGNKEIVRDGVAVLFSYLFIGGYLTIDGHAKHSYKLPNMEIVHDMGRKLMKYYQYICSVDHAKIHSVTNVLRDLMRNHTGSRERMQELFKIFYDRVKELIGTVKLVSDKNEEGIFAYEDTTHSLLNDIALQLQHTTTFCNELYATKLHSKHKGRVDIKITGEDMGLIMEILCVPVSDRSNNQMKEALEHAMSYSNLLDTHSNLFIAINIDQITSTLEERTIECLCASAMSDGHYVFGINALADNDNFGVDNSIMEPLTSEYRKRRCLPNGVKYDTKQHSPSHC